MTCRMNKLTDEQMRLAFREALELVDLARQNIANTNCIQTDDEQWVIDRIDTIYEQLRGAMTCLHDHKIVVLGRQVEDLQLRCFQPIDLTKIIEERRK